MKKAFLFFFLLVRISAFAQSVAINADSSVADPSAILDLKSTIKGMLIPRMTLAQRNVIATPAIGLLIYQTDNTPGFYYYDGGSWSAVKGGGGGGGGGSDPYWSVSGTNIANLNTGNVGIGTSTPDSKLTIQTASGSYGMTHTDGTAVLSTYVGGGTYGAWFGTRTAHDLFFFTNNSQPRMAITKDGYIGIGVAAPVNKFQIGSVGSSNFAGADIAYGYGDQATEIFQNSTYTMMNSTSDIIFWPRNRVGNVGINSKTELANHLEIGNLGTVPFAGNDIAIGNGTNATGIAQTNNLLQVATTTDIAFLPKYGTNKGFVGINTATPHEPLDVAGYVTIGNVGYYWYYTASNSQTPNEGSIFNAAPTISIHADAAIFATEYDAFSDARIKDVRGVSNGLKDLKTLNSIRVTDYTMKDKVKYGNRAFKKVIAQEVEKVYPQVVSRHAEFIPNVYRVTDAIEKRADGYCLRFAAGHTLTADAKLLRIIPKEEGPAQEYTIVSIPSPNEVVIAARELHADTLFVYGQEVPDLRTVDYEGLTTLNISATQELSKEVAALQRQLKQANERIEALAAMMQKRSGASVNNRLTSAKYVPATKKARKI